MERRVPDPVFMAVLFLLLARHVWLAAFIHPYADDLSYAWTGMHSALGERLVLEYKYWNGRYFSNILVLRGPLVLGLEQGLPLYRMVPVVLMVLFIAAAYALLREMFAAVLSKLRTLIAAMSFLLLYVHLMPHAGEGLYWYTGAVTYLFPSILLLVFAVLQLRGIRVQGSGARAGHMGLSAALVAAIIGSNEVHMVLVLALHVLCLYGSKSFRGRPEQWMLFAWIVACASVVVLAPGNAMRGAHFHASHDPLRTIAFSTLQTVRFTGWWLLSPVFLLASLMVLRWGRSCAGASLLNDRLHRYDRWSVLILPFGLVLLTMVLPYWSTGMLGQHRTVNVALFVFLPLAWLALLVWDAQVFRPKGWALAPRWLPQRAGLLLLMTIGLLVLRHDGAVSHDLLQGYAGRYDAQCMERYAKVRAAIASGNDRLVLDALDLPPRSLNVLDLGPDPGNWMNTSLARYLGSDSLEIICLEAD
jgi:hypothetical protein